MPLPAIDKLTKDSSAEQIKEAISSCIASEIKRGKEKDQAVAMCYEQARKKTGRSSLLSKE